MEMLEYPVLSVKDGAVFEFFLGLIVLFPLCVFTLYVAQKKLLPAAWLAGGHPSPRTLPKCLLAASFVALASPLIIICLNGAWKHILYTMHLKKLERVPHIIQQYTPYTEVQVCSGGYISINAPVPAPQDREAAILALCNILQNNVYDSVFSEHIVTVIIWNNSRCVKKFKIPDKNPGTLAFMCFKDGEYMLTSKSAP